MAFKIRTHTAKKELKEPIEFVSAVEKLGFILSDNIGTLWMVLAVTLVAGGGVGAYWFYQQKQESRAAKLEYHARQYYQNENSGEPAEGSLSHDENIKKAIEIYQELIRDYPNTGAASLAHYYLGNAFLELHDLDSATTSYQSFLEGDPKSNVLKGMTHLRLGYAYLEKNHPDNAAKAFESVGDIPGALNHDLSTYELGRLYESLGNRDQAVKYYQRVVNRFPNSTFLPQTLARLTILGVPAGISDRADQAGQAIGKPDKELPPPAAAGQETPDS